MRQLTRETEERNRLLLDEKHSIQRHYQQLKQRIKIYRTTQNQRLLHLSQSANNCKKVLNDKLEVARYVAPFLRDFIAYLLFLLFLPFALIRGVLQLNELSRRMETMLEQILPFSTEETDPNVVFKEELEMQAGESGNNAAGMKAADGTGGATAAGQGNGGMKVKHKNKFGNNQISAIPHQSSVFASDQRSFVPHADRLANFYRKYNRILLDNVAINKEKERLQIENSQLQDLIQQYLDGMKISDDILADDNPLFVVNGRFVFCGVLFLLFFISSCFLLELILIMTYQ
jgi:hypothetical protein